MTAPRKAHAIHKMRRRMNAASARLITCGHYASEIAALIGKSLEHGGTFHEQREAADLLEQLISELKSLAIESACVEHEPGHTQRRVKADNDASPLLESEAA